MSEVTDEMYEAFELAAYPQPDSETIHIREGLAAVLAIVERDYRTEPPWDRPTCTCCGSSWPHAPSSERCTPLANPPQ